MQDEALPIDAVLPELEAILAAGPAAVLAAPPGAGKTTRVPIALLDADWTRSGKLLILEPRRIAARAAAERMASTLGERVGQSVGYRIRGEIRVGPSTRIEVITEGVLTRMLQSDPELPGIAGVIFDEVHERSIHTDLGLALTLEAQRILRPELRVLAMSATLDVGAFARVMGDVPVLESAGRMHPVETRWLERPWRPARGRAQRGAFEAAARDLIEVALAEQAGDVLVFLPGAREIERVARLLDTGTTAAIVVSIHGALPLDRQRAALQPDAQGRRKVVLASAIAETSLTVEGVRVVVDCGRSRRARLDAATGLSRLVTEPVSRAEAAQRRGRAGRLAPGVCYRMWTRGEEGALPPYAPPEILTGDLVPLALELAVWGAHDPTGMAFLDPPPEGRLSEARELLTGLGALDADGQVTAHGRAMAQRGLHPRLAHLVLSAQAEGLGAEAATIAAILAERDPLRAAGSSLLTDRIKAVLSDHAAPGADRAGITRIRAEARRLAPGRADREAALSEAGRLAALAYPDRIALRRAGAAPRYLLSSGRGAVLADNDPLAVERLLVATDLEDGREARIRVAVPISEADLRAVYGARIKLVDHCAWSSRQQSVETRRREMLGALALSDVVWADAPPERTAEALADGVRELGISRLPWSKSAQNLRARVAWLVAQEGPNSDLLPDWSDETLTATLDDWLTPHLASLNRIERIAQLDLTAILSATIDWELRREIDRLAPARFALPLGGSAFVDYSRAEPQISVRVQELYGMDTHPQIGDPPVPLILELVSPAGRPVQITRDLPGFWQSSYSDVRKDMRARYPKHPWPENPASAQPTRRPKRGKM